MRSVASRSWTTAAVGALVLGLVAAPAAATPRTASSAPAGSDMTCFDDPTDDTRQDPDGTPTPSNEPRADLVEHCVAFGPTVSLSARVAFPTDPLTDDAWQDATFVGWFVDTDADGEGDYFVDYSLEANAEEPTLGVSVQELRSGEDAVEVCSAEVVPSETGWYAASHLAPSCFGGATSISVQAAAFYEDESGDVHFDAAPDGEAFTAAVAQGEDTRPTDRLAGAERIATSIKISQHQFPDGAARVFLARSRLFADAVAGGVLRDGPIILVPSCGDVPQIVKDEVERLDPDHVVALGGTNAICDQVLSDAAGDRAVGRLKGETRIGTAVAISQFTFTDPAAVDEVYLARRDVFADAVAGGVLQGGPILLVPSCGPVPDQVSAEIARLDPETVYALGGDSAVCDATLAQASSGYERGRLAGPTRIGTAIAISQHAFPLAGSTVHLARANPNDKLADAVVGGVLTDGPVLLVPQCAELPLEVAAEISRVAPTEVLALGGDAAVCDAVLSQAGAA